MMNPFPNINKAYAMITYDKSQRMTAINRVGGDIHESMTLYSEKKK